MLRLTQQQLDDSYNLPEVTAIADSFVAEMKRYDPTIIDKPASLLAIEALLYIRDALETYAMVDGTREYRKRQNEAILVYVRAIK